jgi:zinc protease
LFAVVRSSADKERGMRLRLFCVMVGVLAICGCAAERTDIRFGALRPEPRSVDYKPGIATWTLPNKLTVAVLPDDRVNLVSVEVRYTVGAADDPPGKEGLAHLVEHLMFERKSQDGHLTLWDRLSLASLGHNAATSDDHTHYYAIGLADKLDDLLAIDLERMASGCKGIDQATLDHERAVVLDEALQRHYDERDKLRGALFGPGHPYGKFDGTRDLAGITLDDVCRFIDAHYAPDRAILVLSGRIPREAVHTIWAKFGAIQRRATGHQIAVESLHPAGETVELTTDLVESPTVVVAFPDAPWGSKEWIYDQMMWSLASGVVAGDQTRLEWMLGVSRYSDGGERAAMSGVMLRLKDARYADEAVARVFAAIHQLHTSVYDEAWISAAGTQQSELLERLESIHDRGALAASYLQFTTHGQFQLFQLAELQHADRQALYHRAELHTRDTARILRLAPPADRDRAGHLKLTGALAELDTPSDTIPVDAREAERPIALAADARPSGLRERRLANGLRVIMLANAHQPVFEARMVFPVGATAELEGKRELPGEAAALLQHDWDRERELTPLEQVTVTWVSRVGPMVQHWVDDATTTFSVSGFSLFADAELWRMHWLLDNGIFDPIQVARFPGRVAAEARRHDEDRVRDQLLRRTLFGADHPYARDNRIDVRVAAAKAITRADLGKFRDAFYRAHGATLILVGNFDPDAMDRQIDDLFGPWSAAPAPATAAIPAMRPPSQPTWLTMTDPEENQVRATLVFPAASPRKDTRGARAILGPMLNAHLNQVRKRFGASYGVYASYQLTLAGDYLHIDGELDAARAGDALGLIQRALDSLRTGGPALARQFVLARRAALAGALADPMRSSVAADRIERAVSLGLPADAAQRLPAEIAATTLQDVQALIAQDLDPAHLIGIVSGQPGEVDKALAAVKSR